MYKTKTLYNPATVEPQRVALKVGKTPIEIALGIDDQGRTTAKKLYAFLELAQSNYSRWCRSNITENDFAEESIDFVVLSASTDNLLPDKSNGSSLMKNENRGRFNPKPTQDYILTATFAKKLAMASNSARGEQAREYFIRVEEQLKKVVVAGLQTEQMALPRVTLDEIEVLDRLQASTRYNLGRDSLLSVGRECGGLVFIGRRILYNRRKFDQYFENYRG